VARPTRRAKDERASAARQAAATTPFNAYIDG
jgi:hypothetical protein